jgi:hypothetical protein
MFLEPAALRPTKKGPARTAELVKDFNRTEHELALAGDAKNYGMAVTNQKRTRRRRFWTLVSSTVMAAVGIWLR